MLSQVTRFASVQDVALDRVEIELRATFPQEGKYGLDPTVGVAMEKLTYWIDIHSDASADRIARLIETADGACHAANSLRVPVPVEGILRLNGAEVPFTPPVPPESRVRRAATAEGHSGSGAGPAGSNEGPAGGNG